MVAELSMLSLNQLQNLAQSELQQLNPNSTESGSAWMWNPKKQAVVQEENDDDSWEVRAFAEDTGNVMGTTWPPRSYTCTFCRREFRSAQALGGHMNVHRRDRARLHQTHTSTTSSNSSSSSSTLMIPTQEFVAHGGLCFLYQLPNPNGVFTPKITNSPINLPSTLLSISPYLPNNMVSPPHPPPPINYSLAQTTSKAESSSIPSKNNGSNCDIVNKNCKKDSTSEELDLELRLGH